MSWEFEWFKAFRRLRDGEPLSTRAVIGQLDPKLADQRIQILKWLPLEKIVEEKPPRPVDKRGHPSPRRLITVALREACDRWSKLKDVTVNHHRSLLSLAYRLAIRDRRLAVNRLEAYVRVRTSNGWRGYSRDPGGSGSQEHRDDRAKLASVARLYPGAVDRLVPPPQEEPAENRTDTTTDTSELEAMETASKSVH
jgi:hypothetical protein